MPTVPSFPPSIDQLRTIVGAVCANRKVARVDAFGSIARNEARPGSDIDLLIEFIPDFNAGLLEMGAIKEDLEDRLGCPIDLVSRPAVERSRNPYRRKSILEKLVPVYAR